MQLLNIGSFAIAWYAGLNAVIPGIGMFTIVFLANKYKRLPKDTTYLNLIAIIGGYALGGFAGGLLMKEVGALIDAVLLLGLATWFWFRPGFWSVTLMILHASLGLITNVPAILAVDIGSFMHKALFTHILIQMTEIGLAGRAFWLQVKRERAEESALLAHYSR